MPNVVSLNHAADLLGHAKRALIIGCSGGGKTTLALKISHRFHLEYLSIDRDVRWLPGWQMRDRDAQRNILAGLVSRDRWVMDGSGPSTFDICIPRADLVIWVRVPRMVAMLGLARRVMRNYGKVRVAMAPGCPEPLPDRAFLSYIWNFDRDSAPKFVAQVNCHGPTVPVVVLNSYEDGMQLIDPKPS